MTPSVFEPKHAQVRFSGKLRKTLRWLPIVRDGGLLLGVPALIVIASKIYTLHISALGAQNSSLQEQVKTLQTQVETLKQTQYGQVGQLIEGYKKIASAEKELLQDRISLLSKDADTDKGVLNVLREQLQALEGRSVWLDTMLRLPHPKDAKFTRLTFDLDGHCVVLETLDANRKTTGNIFEDGDVK